MSRRSISMVTGGRTPFVVPLQLTKFLVPTATLARALAQVITTSLLLSTIVLGQEVVLKDGKRIPGTVQKYENGLAYVLLIQEGQSKPMLTTVPEEVIDKEATEATHRSATPTNNEMTRSGSTAKSSPSTSSTPRYQPGHGGSQGLQVPTRADLLRAERQTKADATSPPKRTGAERGVRTFGKVARFMAINWKGIHFAGGDFPAGAGFAFGVGFTDLAVGSIYEDSDLPNRVDLDFVTAYSTSEYFRIGGELTLRNLGGAPFNAAFRGQFYEFPEEDFFGLGLDTQEDDRTSYLLRSTEVGGDLWLEPTDGLRVGGGLTYLKPTVASGRDGRFPSTEELFDPASIPGFEAQPDFLRLDGLVAFDWRDRPMRPRSGGYYGARISRFIDQDFDSFDFRRYEVDLQQYFPWLHGYRVLALRGLAVLTDTDAGNEVPFYYMPTLGGGDRLRGFREFRFRERNSVLLTAEYRWEAWWPLEMALFVDAGRVALDRDDLFEDWEASYGIGFRFHNTESVAFRLDLAFSREGFIPFLRYTHVF